MAISRDDFNNAKAGDKFIDALGDEYFITSVIEQDARTIFIYIDGVIQNIQMVNGTIIDHRSKKMSFLNHPRARFAPSDTT